MDDLVGILVAVVLIGDVDIRPGEDIVPDQDRVVRDYVAAAPDHAAIPHPHHRVRPEVMAGHHACAQGDLGRDHGLVADVYPALAKHRSGRECHQGARAEGGEPAAGG